MVNRDLEERLDALEREFMDSRPVVDVVIRDGHGNLVDYEGEPTEQDPDADLHFVINRSVVMSRERAIEEGRTILGPAENAPEGRDVVRVSEYDDVDTEVPGGC